MTETCALPAFAIDEAVRIVRDLYGIDGSLQRLNGERDSNYLVTTDRGRFVFKIANRDETYALLECQHQALERLAADKVMPQQTSSVVSVNARAIETITGEDGIDYFCRMLHYIEGRLLSAVTAHTPELLINLGKTLARLDVSLQGFKHEALNRRFIWNMIDALTTLEGFKPFLESNQKREMVEYFETLFRNTVLPSGQSLRQAVIHNDANDNNLLVVGDSADELTISSIIDFGDMVYSWLAVEPAVAAAYAMMGKNKPLEAAASIFRGYHESLPLRENEIAVLFELICMRLCMSVCICARQKSIEPDNEYLKISEQPAWDLLHKLSYIQPAEAHNLFREACGLAPETN
jgi:Ser/Thr protein kinase RdoA (MazF antagonist)